MTEDDCTFVPQERFGRFLFGSSEADNAGLETLYGDVIMRYSPLDRMREIAEQEHDETLRATLQASLDLSMELIGQTTQVSYGKGVNIRYRDGKLSEVAITILMDNFFVSGIDLLSLPHADMIRFLTDTFHEKPLYDGSTEIYFPDSYMRFVGYCELSQQNEVIWRDENFLEPPFKSIDLTGSPAFEGDNLAQKFPYSLF